MIPRNPPSSRCTAALVAIFPLALAACVGSSEESSGNPHGPGSGGADAGSQAGDAGGAGGSGGPVIRIHLKANTDPFTQTDGLSGETPLAHSSGMRKYQLFKDANDASPITVFDYGTGFVEAGYENGDDTVVATVDPKTLPEGLYTLGRVVHSHVRYRIAATLHSGALTLPGEFDNLQVLSDGTLIDGVKHDHGYYNYVFKTGNQSYPTTGTNAPVPTYAGTGGFSVKFENGEWAYYFPVHLTLVKNLPADIDMVMEVNMRECFRWEDQMTAGFAPGVFDVTPTTFEPVKKFGANSFAVYLK